ASPTLPIDGFSPSGAAVSLSRSRDAAIVSGFPSTAVIGPSAFGWIVCSTLITTAPLEEFPSPSVTVYVSCTSPKKEENGGVYRGPPVAVLVTPAVPSPVGTIRSEKVYDGVAEISCTFWLATRLGTIVGWVCNATGTSNGVVMRGATSRSS